MIIILAILICGAQVFTTEAYMYEKAGRVAPITYLQTIICCLADIIMFGTSLSPNQVLGGILIIATNFTIALLKALDIIS